MDAKNALLILLGLNLIAAPACLAGERWGTLSPYARQLVAAAMPAGDRAFTAEEVGRFVSDKGTRSATYLVAGMLMRDGPADRANAVAALRTILTLQYDMPGKRLHGVWKTSPRGDRRDENWREFVGVGLIIALERFRECLPKDLVGGIDRALVRAAEGASRRIVRAEYTNIALLNSFLLDYVGHRFNQPNLCQQARDKAKAIHDGFSLHKTFSEYNSPTYYGVDLLGLTLWRELAPSDELRRWGASMEADLWRDIGQFYHAGMKNMAGPFTRSYGMDMTQYVALAGLRIALVLDDPALAPLPTAGSGQKQGEYAYGPLFTLLKPTVPADAMSNLREFQGSRELTRTVPDRPGLRYVQAVLERRWMMGAATGPRARSEQHYPATIHWQAGQAGELGWLLVRGENAADVTIEGRTLKAVLLKPDTKYPLRVQVQAPGLAREQIGRRQWTLPGMTLTVESLLPAPTIDWYDDPGNGKVLEVCWPVPEGFNSDHAVLSIQIEPRSP